MLNIRQAAPGDREAILHIGRLAQANLTAGGSIQRLEGYSGEDVVARIGAGQAYVLAYGPAVIGSVFVVPVTAVCRSYVWRWNTASEGEALWFLYGLALHPDWQGHGLGGTFLRGVRAQAARPPGVLVLDCWAGNEKLKAFYTRAGFALHGLFDEEDYQVAAFTWRHETENV